MLGLILSKTDFNPTVIVGSNVKEFGGNLRIGDLNNFVVEGDEYRKGILELHPETIVLTNVEYDHPDIYKTFETDYYGTPLDSLPMMRGIHNYDQIALVVSLTGSATPWITFANARYRQEVGLGVTAVMAPEYYPYLQTNQLVGMIGGLKGAAEYETLLNKKLGFEGRKAACIGMDSQSIVHLVMIVFIVLGNIAYFATKKSRSNP